MTGFGRPARPSTLGARPLLRWSLAAGLVGTSVLAFAAPSGAAASDSVTINHSTDLTIRTSQRLTVQASAAATCTLGLTQRTVSVTLTGPPGSHSTTSTLASTKAPCNKPVDLRPRFATPARNGSYTVTLRNGSASRTTNATLWVRVPPSAPKHFAVAADGTEATFAWSVNPEPDVVAYFITTPSGHLVKPVRAAVACNTASTCATRVDLGSSAAGHTESFVIHAIRCGITCSKHLAGPDSARASAFFTTPPPLPTPPPAPVETAPAPVETSPASSPPATSAVTVPPATPTMPPGGSSPPAGQSSPPAPPASSSSAPPLPTTSPPVAASSAPAPSGTAVAAASSSSSNNSGGDWAVRVIAIVLVLVMLALFVRALSQRASTT